MFRKEGYPDLCMVSNPTNGNLTNHLKARFDREEIYSNIGDVLVSVNPYRSVEAVGDD